MYDASKWRPKIQALCNHARHPDLTFAEAFEVSGRELCVTVTARRRHEPPLMLSRLSAPDVTIASAVLATVAMPFLVPAQSLACKGADGRLRPWVASAAVSSDESAGCEGEKVATAAGSCTSCTSTTTATSTHHDACDVADSGNVGSHAGAVPSAGAEWRDGVRFLFFPPPVL